MHRAQHEWAGQLFLKANGEGAGTKLIGCWVGATRLVEAAGGIWLGSWLGWEVGEAGGS